MTDRKLIIANLLQRAMNALLYAHIPFLDDYAELKYVIIEYDEVLRETLAQTERIAQLEHDLKAERERVEKAEAELAALKEALRNPTPEMIEDCGRRLLRFQDDSTDESFSKLQWAEVKQDAERVIAEFAAHLLKEKNT